MKLSERKASVLRSKSEDELKSELLSLLKEQFNLRFQRANLAEVSMSRARWVRKKIAVIKTVLSEKKTAA
jgi:large subunit ribosomal protein L29